MRKINTIVVHCSATPPSMDIGVEEIRKWHVEENSWTDIGYHFVIRRDGTVESGRSLKRPGAHVKNYNSDSIGICWVGGVSEANGRPQDNRSAEQTAALFDLIQDLQQKFPGTALMGHRDFEGVTKACPCFDVREWFVKQCNTEKKELEEAPAKEERKGALEKMALLSTTFKFILSITWKLWRHHRSSRQR